MQSDLGKREYAENPPFWSGSDYSRLPKFEIRVKSKILIRKNEDFWLWNRDSNPNKQSQSLSCYRYTIPQ